MYWQIRLFTFVMVDPLIKDIVEYLEYGIKEEDWDSVQEALDILKEEFLDRSSDDFEDDEY
jgi:hypothetical protein